MQSINPLRNSTSFHSTPLLSVPFHFVCWRRAACIHSVIYFKFRNSCLLPLAPPAAFAAIIYSFHSLIHSIRKFLLARQRKNYSTCASFLPLCSFHKFHSLRFINFAFSSAGLPFCLPSFIKFLFEIK